MKTVNEHILKIKEDINTDKIKVLHFRKNLKGYYANIICCEFDNQIDLEKNWEEIVDNVAINIQAKMNKTIELYNIYLLFFIENINTELMYEIEQNKYSSRKIILEMKIPESLDELKSIIDNKLFKFNIEDKNQILKLEQKLNEINSEFYDFIINTETICEEDTEKLSNILNYKK